MTALLYAALHVCLTVVVLDAYRGVTGARAWRRLAVAPALHLAFALLTLLAGAGGGGCVAQLPALAAVVGVAALAVAHAVRAPGYAAKTQMRAWEVLTRQRVESMRRAAEGRAAAAAAATGAGRGAPRPTASATGALPRPADGGALPRQRRE
jgi:hypothetical protein